MNTTLSEIVRQKWQFLVVIFLFVVANSTISYLISAVQQPKIDELRAQWSELRRQSPKKQAVDLVTLHRQYTSDLAQLMDRVPAKGEFARVVGDLLESAQENSIEVSNASYKMVPVKEDTLKCYQLSFTGRGSYAAVKSYLADILRSQELIVVDSVAFVNSDHFSDTVSMNLRVAVFLRGTP